jgi:hypothetical protein
MINDDIIAIKDNILNTIRGKPVKKLSFSVPTLMEPLVKAVIMIFLWF